MIINFFFIFFVILFLDKNTKASTYCGQYTEKIAKEYKIPNKLLTSISLVESGLKKVKILFLGLGTTNVSGKSKFFNSKDENHKFFKKKL